MKLRDRRALAASPRIHTADILRSSGEHSIWNDSDAILVSVETPMYVEQPSSSDAAAVASGIRRSAAPPTRTSTRRVSARRAPTRRIATQHARA
jgi:hypothetical protein